jgi:hypothetical protein
MPRARQLSKLTCHHHWLGVDSKVPCIAICLYRVSTKFRHHPTIDKSLPAATKAQFPLYTSLRCSSLSILTAGKMITKFMTEVTAKFNPFSTCAKPARLFLTFLPPNVRANGTVVNTALLPRDSAESSSLRVKFSTTTWKKLLGVIIERGANSFAQRMARKWTSTAQKSTSRV